MTLSRRNLFRYTVALPLVRAAAPPSLPPGTPVRVVWVWPQGELLDTARATEARKSIGDALDYWNARAGFPGLYTLREEAISIADPYASWAWLQALDSAAYCTVAVVVNTGSRRYVDLGGGIAAPAYNWPGKRSRYASLWAGDEYSYASVGAQVAHELGHMLYNLKDGDPAWPIMGSVDLEWQSWVGRCK